MAYRDSTAERTTITRNIVDLEEKTGNVYKSIVILSKRANQINAELKEELTSKLEEFASSTDNLEEIFENREQIEVSRFYERLPKPGAMSMQEYEEDKIYWRKPDSETNS
ncbi:DNA-directed RNA polymerase subunit omega [bacterium]|nr:DNA-directed RNA polymerase subunit omega [bacterium]MDC0338067.1 DNA-directed RNA polymerase subunit omega [Flavobacteriales bacterium]